MKSCYANSTSPASFLLKAIFAFAPLLTCSIFVYLWEGWVVGLDECPDEGLVECPECPDEGLDEWPECPDEGLVECPEDGVVVSASEDGEVASASEDVEGRSPLLYLKF